MLGKKRQKKEKPPRWKGELGDADRRMRVMIFVELVVLCASLTFTELGFAGIGTPGGYVAYAVVLLQPVALAALLFGAGYGSLLGLIAGVILHIHTKVMPLNFYEIMFVTPLTSIVMLPICGFLLGKLFGRALRNDPPPSKRILRIALICLFVSALYSFTFVIGAIFSLTEYAVSLADTMTEAQLNKFIDRDAVRMALRLGSIRLQILIDAVLMALISMLGDRAASWLLDSEESVSLHRLFNEWLGAVVLLAFLITAALGFGSITYGEYHKAEDKMKGEVEYLCDQLDDSVRKADTVQWFLDEANVDLSKVDEEKTSKLFETLSVGGLLDGYAFDEDGLLYVLFDNLAGVETGPTESGPFETYGDDWFVVLSDHGTFEGPQTVEDQFGHDIVEAIGASLSTGASQRVIYDYGADVDTNADDLVIKTLHSEVSFLYAERTGHYIVTMIMPATMVFADRGTAMAWTSITAFILLLTVFVLVSRLLRQVVVKRIDDTNEVLADITEGDLDARVEAYNTREFKSLSTGINTTVEALKGWIAEAETRMDAELATAKAIQEAALPRTFPPFPDIMHFDIYASMCPAREVGGDFYDFFLIGEDSDADAGRLGFVIADVSGKGVPAALFMMAAKTLIRDYMASGMELGEALENANHQLCDNNDAGMFVTVFAGVLDYATGHLTVVNAGHNPPLLWQQDSWTWLRKRSGLPLGLFDGLPYKAYELDCLPGDQLLMYTDGVTEAMNVSEQQYGEARLETLAQESYTLHPRMLVDVVREDVARFTEGAEQSDDITILTLEIGVPPELTATLEVPARIDELNRVNSFIHSELDRRLCPLRAQNQIDVAVEELFVNVVNYAYAEDPENPGMVRVSYTYTTDPPSIKIDLVDEGMPFDPLAKPDAKTPADIMDVPIGGLGILMAKKSVDEMTYERVDDTNVVSIVKRW